MQVWSKPTSSLTRLLQRSTSCKCNHITAGFKTIPWIPLALIVKQNAFNQPFKTLHNLSIPGLLNLSSIGIFSVIILCCAGCPLHCRMLSGIPGLDPLDASRTLHSQLWQPKISTKNCQCLPSLRIVDLTGPCPASSRILHHSSNMPPSHPLLSCSSTTLTSFHLFTWMLLPFLHLFVFYSTSPALHYLIPTHLSRWIFFLILIVFLPPNHACFQNTCLFYRAYHHLS